MFTNVDNLSKTLCEKVVFCTAERKGSIWKAWTCVVAEE